MSMSLIVDFRRSFASLFPSLPSVQRSVFKRLNCLLFNPPHSRSILLMAAVLPKPRFKSHERTSFPSQRLNRHLGGANLVVRPLSHHCMDRGFHNETVFGNIWSLPSVATTRGGILSVPISLGSRWWVQPEMQTLMQVTVWWAKPGAGCGGRNGGFRGEKHVWPR